MPRPERQQNVLDLLKGLRGIEPLKQLFWSELNYQRVNEPLSRRGWTDSASQALADDPVLFAGGGEDNDFHVIYGRLASDRLLLGNERPVVSRLVKEHPYALFVFSNKAQDRWHFLNVKYDDSAEKRRLFRRITVGPEERLRTASERISLLSLDAISQELFGIAPLTIQQHHDEAFDVEAVTKQFFEEYKALFGILQDDLKRQTKNNEWAHDYALQFLNRCMFLYFVQRKRWLGDDTEFLRSFWEAYKRAGQPKDSFFDRWLKVLFFEAFNNKFHGGHRHFPDDIKGSLAIAPYLNGGLFAENELDTDHTFNVTDARFAEVFKFLERYNFTIAEDSPLDQEVAVDPEMIGKVYESLVNVSTEADERGDAGIFYTPRTEIDLMCRLSVVDYLANHLGNECKNLLYEMVFAFEVDEKVAADKAVALAKLWPQVDALLRAITAVDLACGSGSFVVGMLHVLDDLQERANRQLGRKESAFDRKKRIIGQSLYGVDVMDWACHVAELRLWLALVIDADFTREELHVRKEPLLPHFTFKIRCGDSLVEEVGGINLAHLHSAHGIPASLKARITKLKVEKLKFYNNERDRQFRTADQAKQEELNVFRAVLDEREKAIEDEIKSLRRRIERPSERQIRLDGTVEQTSHQMKLDATELQKKVESSQADLQRVGSARAALKTAKDVPFVWDIAFVEIFGEDKDGFDIVMGNPPYVRQENISDPRLSRDEVTTENKKVYKAKLARSVYQAFPRFFGYKASTDTAAHKLDAKSDLYIYFYFHGLSLLNPKGSFCFITANSWLDVGYGADLQEFLLKHSHVKLIIDNKVKRSFASADVNTVIVLLASPDETRESGLTERARFLVFGVPFEQVLSPVFFEEVEKLNEMKRTPEYRLCTATQESLLEEGLSVGGEDVEEEATVSAAVLARSGRFVGAKWGGKYLRAPDILYDILGSGNGKLVPLGTLADIRFGIKTGANDFFYLDSEAVKALGIEKRFLKPVIKTPRDCPSIHIHAEDLNQFAFMCNASKAELRGTAALRYIEMGEKQGLHRLPSLAGRRPWYSIPEIRSHVLWWKSVGERYCCFWNPEEFFADQRNYPVICAERLTLPLLFSLNSTFDRLFVEVGAREMTGAYTIVELSVEAVRQKLTIHPDAFTGHRRWPAMRDLFQKMAERRIENLDAEIRKDDRNEIDEFIAEAIGLPKTALSELYGTLTELVYTRLKKSKSVIVTH
jgi:hypothetical protein